MIQLNYRDSRPIYLQIKEELQKLIVSGAIQEGERLPSVRTMATQLAINPNTIQRAYNELESDGFIFSVPGKGSFAAGKSEEHAGRRSALVEQMREMLRELRYLGVTESELQTMIEVQGLTKTFQSFRALDNASLHVPDGAIYGLVGPNGAGKSTLIRHLTGIYWQDSGTVLIDGAPVYENPAVKCRIAAIPDDWYYFLQATPQDMMRFYRGLYSQFNVERYEALKEVFSINEKTPIRRLSKGMQKQVAFWLAMSTMPDYLILDEPVDGLDPVMRRQVWSLIMNDVSARGTTVLISSHNLRELEDVCDHVGIMNQGQLLLERSLNELQENTLKIQVVFADYQEQKLPENLQILHHSAIGRVNTYIIRGDSQRVQAQIAALNPLLMDAVPLTLEEVFIYELGGADYAVKDILL